MAISWNIGGGFTHPDMFKLFFVKRPKGNFSIYDGVNLCAWNGGRINRNVWFSKEVYDYYRNNNIGVGLTFSNPVIDLDDNVGNALLEACHDSYNHIVLVNDNLREHIRSYYPKYILKASVTGIFPINVPMTEADYSMYRRLEELYDVIVPRYEHIFDPMFLKLDQSKYEIMTNDTCIYNCPHWKEHFEKEADINRYYAGSDPWWILGEEHCKKIEECWIPGFDPSKGDAETIKKYGKDYGMDLTIGQIQRLIDRGVTKFKISGRELSSGTLLNEIGRYSKIFNL